MKEINLAKQTDQNTSKTAEEPSDLDTARLIADATESLNSRLSSLEQEVKTNFSDLTTSLEKTKADL